MSHSINIRELIDNTIEKKFNEILEQYNWCTIAEGSVNGTTYITIDAFEAYAMIGFYSGFSNDVVTNCIVSIGKPENIEKYRKEELVRNDIMSYFNLYYNKGILIPDEDNILIVWDIDETRVLLYCVSVVGAISLQLYHKNDPKADLLIAAIKVQPR